MQVITATKATAVKLLHHFLIAQEGAMLKVGNDPHVTGSSSPLVAVPQMQAG
jgi:hypothetical protein